MNKHNDPSPEQLARLNRQRLAVPERAEIKEEAASKAIAVRENMARLRELRLAKEAQAVRTEISTGNRPAKAKPKRRF
jgi:hypothetical protein